VRNRKEIRNAIGWTYQRQLADPLGWYKEALDFHKAAIAIHQHEGHFTRTFAFNAGLSLELALKAILAAQHVEIPATHKLVELANLAKIELEINHRDTLEIFAVLIEWAGRYPAPTAEQKWDDFHDRILESQTIRRTSGNQCKVLADRTRFPNLENYNRLWRLCQQKFGELVPDKNQLSAAVSETRLAHRMEPKSCPTSSAWIMTG